MIARAVTDLPDPDSPTSPKVSPRAIEKDTPFTAVRSPRRKRKRTVTSSSSSTASPILRRSRRGLLFDLLADDLRSSLLSGA